MNASEGWVVALACAICAACGGQADQDSAASAEPGSGGVGGTGATDQRDATAGTGGVAAVGGSGAGGGLVGAGGSISTEDASIGSCDCPPGNYSLQISGIATLRHDNRPNDECRDGLLRARGTESCGLVQLDLSACSGADGAPPCLTFLDYGRVEYVDANGVRFSGPIDVSLPEGSVPGMIIGAYQAQVLSENSDALDLFGSFSVCGYVARLLIPC